MSMNSFTERVRSHKFGIAGAVLVTAGATGAAVTAQAPAQPAKATVVPERHVVRHRPVVARRRRVAVRHPRVRHVRHAVPKSHGFSIPASIVMCESGGNYSAVNASSGAGGAYQILPSTWAAYGGTGLPQNAPPAEQDAIAAKIYAAGGPGQWSCG
jgi:hypothetical protein